MYGNEKYTLKAKLQSLVIRMVQYVADGFSCFLSVESKANLYIYMENLGNKYSNFKSRTMGFYYTI